jgi:hypothetical protein
MYQLSIRQDKLTKHLRVQMVHKRNYANQHNIHALMVAKVSTKRSVIVGLSSTGPICWGNAHVAQSLPSIHVKSTKLHGIVITTF